MVWSDWDAESRGFVFESEVGLTMATTRGWLSWDETVALATWLAEKIAAAKEPTP
jgi:hypothetical protein